MYKKIGTDWVEVEEKKEIAGNDVTELMDKANAEIQELNKTIDMLMYFAYMSDSDLMALAKEKGIDGRIKDRKTIIDKINE